MEFEWEPRKAVENRRKHKVTYSDVATMFGDFFSTTATDPGHSADDCTCGSRIG